MKRCIALLLCVGLLLCVTACGKDAPKGDTTATTQSTVTTTTAGESSTAATSATSTTAASSVGTTATVPTDPVGSTTASSATGTTSTSAAPTVAPSTTVPSQTTSSVGTERPTSVTTVSTSTTASSTSATTVTTVPTAKPADVILPAVGSDIDITNNKNRIRVSEASAVYNADGTIAVSLTFRNYSSTWITEETDWVEYTCYDKSGKVVQKATKLSLGCIDTKKNSVRTYTFVVPASTAEVRLTRSKIVYWTEWN